jgi:hypothetical protein
VQTIYDPELNRTGRTWQDRLVGARESFLDWTARARSSPVLNSEHQDPSPIQGRDLPALMREALDRIRSDAMDTQGALVDYADLRNHPAYLEFRKKLSPSLRSFDPDSLPSEAERMVFWINLYHVLVLDAVISFGVKRSVAEGWLGLMSFFRKAAYNVGGHRLSLNDIEHGILRGNAGHPLVPGPHFAASDLRRKWMVQNPDPRIHFTLNCASNSCPPIQVYSAGNFDAQLDLATRSFLGADVKLNPRRKILTISSIFRWYASDFGGREGVISFLLHHFPPDEHRDLLSEHRDRVRLNYKPYDWSLNVSS